MAVHTLTEGEREETHRHKLQEQWISRAFQTYINNCWSVHRALWWQIENKYQWGWWVLWQVGHLSQKFPDSLGSSHTHLPHLHLPCPLQSKPFGDWQVAVDVGQPQLSPVHPSLHAHSPDTHTPRPERDRQKQGEKGYQRAINVLHQRHNNLLFLQAKCTL